MPVHHRKPLSALLLGLPFALAACGGGSSGSGGTLVPNTKPAWLGSISSASYDGSSNDLLTAGLGKTGLAGAAPTYADPTKPTAAELRKVAIYTNYRALIDATAAGGYGRLYGPNIDASGNDTLGEGKIAGEEYIAYGDDAGGAQNVTLMVQIPASFNKAAPCVVSAVSSGSRGVYGAIGTAGDWGLKHGCAVAYADKGSGMGYHDLANDTVNLIDGTRASRKTAGTASHFSAALSDADLAAYNLAFPNRLAIKHVHSQQNPEKDWGRDNLRAIQFAFYLLNQKYGTAASDGTRYADYALPGKVTVIASSVSNGGGAALQAAEQDTQGYISGVAVGEPQIQPASVAGLSIQQGGVAMPAIGKPLIDYFTAANLYQPCAAQSAQLAGANSAFGTATNAALGANRCAALAAKGLISGGTLEAQASDAYAKLRANGWLAESDALHAAHFGLATLSVTLAYVNAYGKFSVKDNICGYSYAYSSATGDVVAPAAGLAVAFGNGNGVPGYSLGGLGIINNLSVGGAKADAASISPSTLAADYNVDGAICLRALATGKDPVTGAALTGDMKAQADRVAAGVAQVQANGNLRGKPAIIVAGRSDALIPVNHAARAYYALNQKTEGANSKLHYVEVTNGQHFDSFLSLPGFGTRFIPLHIYFNRAMDAMWAHLTKGAALPASQVVRTTPRTVATDNVTAANLPAIAAQPAAADAISYANSVLSVPN